MTPLRLQNIILFAFFILMGLIRAASAEKPYYDIPVYDPEAKRYFMLVDARAPPGTPYPRNEGLEWGEADIEARSRIYKGVHGRLAVVDSIQVHEFLLRTFRPDVPAWIGLRYLCKSQRLLRADGKFMSPSSFKAWDANWNQDVFGCRAAAKPQYNIFGEQYMPVAYYAQPTFAWVAKGWGKRYLLYFIEFPTGHS